MKKFILAMSILLVLAGCGPSKADQAAELSTQAEQHYNDGDLQSAKTVYEKSLEIKEDPEVRQKLTLTESEISALATVRQHFDDLRTANVKLLQSIDSKAQYNTAVEIENIINDLVNVQAPDSSSLSYYLNKLKDDTDYFLLKTDVGLFIVSTQAGLETDFTKLNQSIETFLEDHSKISNYK